ncbi:hypothetical protein [Aeromicrobium sp.]|uniref:hypothetical protein n=1 Tax=Aeromicrobium sp. TaxID=1871063 RepID=UPI001992A459|nr:hypothetical protein [Aeromicrobium sp.]MBC7633060.1 hypothetical protein [Aeromicrobium sp.]
MTDSVFPMEAPPWPPTFSDHFLDEARVLLERHPILIIVGPPGSDSHRLASAIARNGPGPHRTRHLARHGEHEDAFYVIRQIVRDLVAAPDDHPDQIVARAGAALSDQHTDPPTVVLLEVDLCDEMSLEVIARLAENGALKVVATLSPRAINDVPRLAAGAQRIDLQPLGTDTIRNLLRARFRCDPHPTTVEFLRARSEGAYGVLRELADAAFESRALTIVEGVLVMDEAADDEEGLTAHTMSTRAIAQVDDTGEIADLVDVAALVGHLDLAEVQACFASSTVEAALGHGALHQVGDAMTFASRAESTLIRSTLAVDRRQTLFDAYSPCFPHSVLRPQSAACSADWWRSVRQPLPLDLACAAARQANLQGQYRRTLAFTDPVRTETGVVAAPLERAYALIELGERQALNELFTMIDPADLSEEELLLYSKWSIQLLSADVRARLPRDVNPPSADADTKRRRLATLELAGLFERSFHEADETLARRARSLAFSCDLSPINRAEAFVVLSAVQRHSGLLEQAVESAQTALDLLYGVPGEVSVIHCSTAREIHIMALIGSIDFAGAEQALLDYSAPSARVGGSARLSYTLWGLLEMFRGDTTQALANLRLSVDAVRDHDPHRVRGWGEALMAQILVQNDRETEARELLERSSTHIAAGRFQLDLERRISQACAHDSLGEPDEALDILAPVIADARAHGLRLAEIDAAVLSVQIGGPGYLPDLLQAVDTTTELTGTAAVWRRFAHASCSDDFETLEELATELHAKHAVVFAAEVAQYALDIASRADDISPAVRPRLEKLANPMSHRSAGRT